MEYVQLPNGLQDGMQRYIEYGILPGHFLTAVLENNLSNAVMRADVNNLKELPNIVKWMHWEIPSDAHGSEIAVKAWIDKFKPVEERKYV